MYEAKSVESLQSRLKWYEYAEQGRILVHAWSTSALADSAAGRLDGILAERFAVNPDLASEDLQKSVGDEVSQYDLPGPVDYLGILSGEEVKIVVSAIHRQIGYMSPSVAE